MSGKGLDMKSWKRFKLIYIIKCWGGRRDYVITVLRRGKCLVGKALMKEILWREWCMKKKNRREGGKYLEKGDEGRVGCGYKLNLLYGTLKDK